MSARDCSERDFAELVRRSRCHDDLLAALRECQAIMDSLRDFVAEGGSRNMVGAREAIAESDVMMGKACAAIAKAEGKA